LAIVCPSFELINFIFVLIVCFSCVILCDMCICVYVTCVFVCCIVVVILPSGKIPFVIWNKSQSKKNITAFTRPLQLYLSWARPFQSTSPHPISQRAIIMVSTYLHLGLPSCLHPSGFPIKNLYAFVSISTTWPFHLIFRCFKIPITLGEGYKSRSSTSCSFLHPPVTSPPFGQNILLSIIFSTPSVYTPSLMSDVKFQIHTESQTKLYFYIFQLLSYLKADG
jgi:hypothetical protein